MDVDGVWSGFLLISSKMCSAASRLILHTWPTSSQALSHCLTDWCQPPKAQQIQKAALYHSHQPLWLLKKGPPLANWLQGTCARNPTPKPKTAREDQGSAKYWPCLEQSSMDRTNPACIPQRTRQVSIQIQTGFRDEHQDVKQEPLAPGNGWQSGFDEWFVQSHPQWFPKVSIKWHQRATVTGIRMWIEVGICRNGEMNIRLCTPCFSCARLMVAGFWLLSSAHTTEYKHATSCNT